MANNLRYLLEHFCLDGQKIDVSSQLDEENADNIEKINTQTVPSINARIDDIKNTDIPSINSRIDGIKNTDIPSINQKINTINNATIPSVQENVTAVDEKADRINESVAKNTRDIDTLSDNVTMQGNSINSINTEKIPSIENKVEIVAHETLRISKAHDKDINDINASLSTLHGETSSNTSNIGNLTTNVNELTSKVNSNTDSINGLTSTVSTNTDSINDLTTKVDTNTGSINDLTTKVGTNTDSINTINNTSIPHLQSEIDNIKGSGTGSIGELKTKVEKNTSDISTLTGEVETNTTAISTINDTSIPNLQNQINQIITPNSWELIKEITRTSALKAIFTIKLYSNGFINFLQIFCNFKDITEPKIGVNYGLSTNEIILPYEGISFNGYVDFWGDLVGYSNVIGVHSTNEIQLTLTLNTLPKFSGGLNTVNSCIFYF